MSEKLITDAVNHLKGTTRGRCALQALDAALPKMTNLDSKNKEAVELLIEMYFGNYPGTVLDSVGEAVSP